MTNVLMVEDDPADARLIREMLADEPADIRLEHAASLAEGLSRMEEQAPDALLLDLALPDSFGIETFLTVHARVPNVPALVLTGVDDGETGSRAVEEGAQDYLVKGQVDGSGLVRAIRYAIRRNALHVELQLIASELERRNAELSAFTYSVSHDLKEPLRTVEAFSQFVMEDYAEQLDAQARDYLTRMAAAATRLKQMIDDLLLLSRAGQRPDALVSVSVAGVVEEAVAALEGLIRDKGARVEVVTGLPAVLADGPRVEQIFGNLISNALKFNHAEAPLVEVGLTSVEQGFGTYYVRDNGIGIDPRYGDRVFQVFQRLHRREEYDGTGAGLAIVKRAAEALGGSVWFTSEPGEGTTFFASLPLDPETAGSETKTQPSETVVKVA